MNENVNENNWIYESHFSGTNHKAAKQWSEGRTFLSTPNNHDRFYFFCTPFDLQRFILV